MRSSGLKRISLSIWHILLLKAQALDLALTPLFLIRAVSYRVYSDFSNISISSNPLLKAKSFKVTINLSNSRLNIDS